MSPKFIDWLKRLFRREKGSVPPEESLSNIGQEQPEIQEWQSFWPPVEIAQGGTDHTDPDTDCGALELLALPSETLPSLVVPDVAIERSVWSKSEECFIWRSGPLGKEGRDWRTLSVSVTAEARVRMILAYESPGAMSLGSVIVASSHKSSYAEPTTRRYYLQGVEGMDAGRLSNLFVASPRAFIVDDVNVEFALKPEAVQEFRDRHPEMGSLPDPASMAANTFYAQYPELLP